MLCLADTIHWIWKKIQSSACINVPWPQQVGIHSNAKWGARVWLETLHGRAFSALSMDSPPAQGTDLLRDISFRSNSRWQTLRPATCERDSLGHIQAWFFLANLNLHDDPTISGHDFFSFCFPRLRKEAAASGSSNVQLSLRISVRRWVAPRQWQCFIAELSHQMMIADGVTEVQELTSLSSPGPSIHTYTAASAKLARCQPWWESGFAKPGNQARRWCGLWSGACLFWGSCHQLFQDVIGFWGTACPPPSSWTGGLCSPPSDTWRSCFLEHHKAAMGTSCCSERNSLQITLKCVHVQILGDTNTYPDI